MKAPRALALAPYVTAASRGDHTAFAHLVDETRSTVTSITLAILRDAELSRDVAQDVYLHVWRDLRRLRDATSFLPWLRQLTRNRAHQALRSHVRRRRRHAPDSDTLLAAAADPSPDAMESLVREEEKRALAEAIGELPPSAREVVVLYYREGRNAAQVAALLDLTEDAVKQRLSRARQRLRHALVRHIEATAPDATFTAAVLAGIMTLAAPAAASAAVVGIGKAGKAGVMLPGLMGAAGLGVLAGLFGGWLGVLFGTRAYLRRARDDEERRGVIIGGIVEALMTLVFVVAMLIRPTPLTATIFFALMMTCFAWTQYVWLPHVTRRRRAAEMTEDPTAGMAREHSRLRRSRLGFVIGLVLGGGAVLLSWFL